MLRRHLLGLPVVAFAPQRQSLTPGTGNDSFVASATEDRTPRVGIVLASFNGSEDHDGTQLKGLRSPARADAPLSAAQLEDMVRKAIELGNRRHGDLSSIVEAEDWVVIKPQIRAHRTAGGRLVAGSVTDPRVVRALMRWLAERHAGNRITIAEAPAIFGGEVDPWTSEWDGAFGKISYRKVVNDLAHEHPQVRFDIVDLNRDETVEMQSPEHAGASEAGAYRVASTLIRCQRLITVVPLGTSAAGVSLTFGSYLGALPAPAYGAIKDKASAPGRLAEMEVDLFSFHPPDYAIVGGEWALEGGDPESADAASIRHNVVLAGANAVAVDAIAAAVMGFEPSQVAQLRLASRRGFGTVDLESIWTRGNEINEAKRRFRVARSR